MNFENKYWYFNSALPNHFCDKLKKYGQLIGRAFQIQDDLLEVVSESSIMGKTLDSDFLLMVNGYIFYAFFILS